MAIKKKHLGEYLSQYVGEQAAKPSPEEIASITGPKDQAQGVSPYMPNKKPMQFSRDDASYGAPESMPDDTMVASDALGGGAPSTKGESKTKKFLKNLLKYGAGATMGALAAHAEGMPGITGAVMGLGLPKYAEQMKQDRANAALKGEADLAKVKMEQPVYAAEQYGQAKKQYPEGYKTLLEATGKYDDPLTTLMKNQLMQSQIVKNYREPLGHKETIEERELRLLSSPRIPISDKNWLDARRKLKGNSGSGTTSALDYSGIK